MHNYLNTRYKKLKKAGYLWQDKSGKCYKSDELCKEYLQRIINSIAFIPHFPFEWTIDLKELKNKLTNNK